MVKLSVLFVYANVSLFFAWEFYDYALRDFVSVTIWRLHDLSNTYECMLTLFFTFL